RAEGTASQQAPVAALKALGGTVELAGNPGRRFVAKVVLRNCKIVNDDLKHLEGFDGLRQLDLGDTNITDKGLERLKGLAPKEQPSGASALDAGFVDGG